MSAAVGSVLIIEDDRRFRKLVADAFPDWERTEAEDGESAIQHLWDGSFDVIVLDLMLPHLSGYDVIRHLSMRRPELLPRTIVVSATAGADASRSFIDGQSVRCILQKPIELTVLRDVARSILSSP